MVRISLTVNPKNPTDEEKTRFERTKTELITAAELAIAQYNFVLEELYRIDTFNLDGHPAKGLIYKYITHYVEFRDAFKKSKTFKIQVEGTADKFRKYVGNHQIGANDGENIGFQIQEGTRAWYTKLRC